MIIETIIKGLLFVIRILFTAVKSIFPFVSIPTQLWYTIGVIIGTTAQANNFIYFIMGDTAFVLIPSILLLITYKYVVYPILTVVIGIFVNKA